MPTLEKVSLKELEKYNFNNIIYELNQKLSPKTVKDNICILKSILYFAEEEYNCNMKVKKIISPKLDVEPLIILNKREKTKIENYCLKENTLKSLGVVICLNTGLRIGEICALRWKDIDLDKRELKVRRTLERVYNAEQKKTKVIIGTPKSRKSVRNIPISNKLYKILTTLKKSYKAENFFLTGDNEKFVEPRNYQDTFKVILKNSKIKKTYKFHILRHTFATDCIEVGMDPKSLSEILGHASVEITLNKYVHSSYNTKKKYLEKL
jgi:integrase